MMVPGRNGALRWTRQSLSMARPPEHPLSPQTQAIAAGREPSVPIVTVNPPIQRGSTVLLSSIESFQDHGGRHYGRAGLAAQDALKAALLAVHGGADAVLVPSGLSACTLALLMLAKPGGHFLVPRSCYGPTRAFCLGLLAQLGVETRFYDPRIAGGIAALIEPDTLGIYMESPGSMTFEIQDVPAITAAATARGVATLIDDTWSAGVLFKPFTHGVDFSIQSLTKHQGGHADLLLGAVIARSVAGAERLAQSARQLGYAVGPEDAFLALRGMRTLHLRLAEQGRVGLEIAQWLEERPEVQRVRHPGLPSHPDHDLWLRDYSGACGVFSVELKPQSRAGLKAMIEGYALIGMGYSWGGFESLVALGSPMERGAGPLLRFSIGLEAKTDLLADLETGFQRLQAT